MTTKARRLLAVTLLFFAATLVVAQAVSPPSSPPDASKSLADLIAAVGTIAIPWAIWGAKSLMPRVPRAILPLVPLVLGWGVDTLSTMAVGTGSSIGAAGIAVVSMVMREVLHTVKQHGLDGGGGEVIPTKAPRLTEDDWRRMRGLPPKRPLP